MKIRLLITGRGFHHGTALPSAMETPDGASLAEVLAIIAALLPADAPLGPSCLVAVSGEHVGTVRKFSDRTLRPGDEIALIAPVAGG